MICPICLKKLPDFKSERNPSQEMIDNLERFNLLDICQSCFEKGTKIFAYSPHEFIDWCKQFDNRRNEDALIIEMRSHFKLNDDLLETDPDKYFERMESYLLFLETRYIQLLRNNDDIQGDV